MGVRKGFCRLSAATTAAMLVVGTGSAAAAISGVVQRDACPKALPGPMPGGKAGMEAMVMGGLLLPQDHGKYSDWRHNPNHTREQWEPSEAKMDKLNNCRDWTVGPALLGVTTYKSHLSILILQKAWQSCFITKDSPKDSRTENRGQTRMALS